MGFSINVGPAAVTFHAQPHGLDSSWSLKYCTPLQSPYFVSHRHLRNIIIGSIVNVLPFQSSWAGLLLSFAAWSHLSLLSDYPKSCIARALFAVVLRVRSCTPWDDPLTY